MKRSQITVLTGSMFRIGSEVFQIDGLRTPRPRGGQCYFERVRGREARKALRRILATGQIVVTPTGAVTPRGYKLADVTVGQRSVRQLMIERDLGLPREGYENTNPWCF